MIFFREQASPKRQRRHYRMGMVLGLAGLNLACGSPEAITEVTPALNQDTALVSSATQGDNVSLESTAVPPASPENPAIAQSFSDGDPEADFEMGSEGEMMRYEAIETAIADENFTGLMGYCFQGTCYDTYYTFFYLEQQTETERLYDLEVLTAVSEEGNDASPRWDIKDASTKVLCSTERPMVVDLVEGKYLVHHISGGQPRIYAFAGLQEPDALYWQVCHGLENADGEMVKETAAALGYDLSKEATVTRQDFLELIEN